MMDLLDIKDSAQEVADAIKAVLKVDVTIINKDCIRVAATGEYRKNIGDKLPENCLFEHIISSKSPEFISNPNTSEKCTVCKLKGNCNELSTLGYPIISNAELLGVVGLIAFDKAQENRIYEDYNSLINFLSKLSYLLAGDLNYHRTIKNLTIQEEKVRTIINGVINGIICTDRNGIIEFVNKKVLEYFKVNQDKLLGKKIENIIPRFDMNYESKSPTEVKIEVNRQKISFMINVIPIVVDKQKMGHIIEINRTSHFVKNAINILERENNITLDDIIGESPQIVKVKNLVKNLSTSQSSILIRGESGTGKELFARAIHNVSNRSNKPFVAINCASIPDNLLESELFGYEPGAFTGASRTGKMGKFELANEGTLFLDEIGDLPIHLQPKLLRVIQEQAFMRVGGNDVISVNFRLIAATNRDLEDMILKNEFREDLYYRLNVIPVYIPALRERIGDIEILSNMLLEKYCNRLGKRQKHFSQEVKNAFMNYNWPGNVRELENVIEYLVNIVEDDRIDFYDLPSNIRTYIPDYINAVNEQFGLKDYIEDYEKNLLEKYLNKYGSTKLDKEEISRLLKIDLSTLYRKLSKYGL